MAGNPRTPARSPRRKPTTVDRIAAAGATIPLRDGGEVVLRFDLATLARLEEHYGSIDAANTALTDIYGAAQASERPWAGPLAEFLTALELDPAAFAVTPLEVVGLLAYAWIEAFPAPDPKGAGQ